MTAKGVGVKERGVKRKSKVGIQMKNKNFRKKKQRGINL